MDMIVFSKKILFGIRLALGLFCCVVVLNPRAVFAAKVYIAPEFKSVSVGDTVILNVEIDTADKTPNAVEGSVLIQEGVEKIEVSKLSVADSALTVWPQVPSWDQSSRISFIGGTPGGFNEKSAVLFKIIFLAKEAGRVTFVPDVIKAYNNDGKGTLLDVEESALTINIDSKAMDVQKNQWSDILSSDNQPPENLTAVFGQDVNLFEGKKLLKISATDQQSGVDYFEVKEGDRPTVRSGDIYVLLDQDETSKLLITAYDIAGNHSQILLQPKNQKINYLRVVVGMGVLLLLLFGLFVLLKLKMNKNVKNKE